MVDLTEILSFSVSSYCCNCLWATVILLSHIPSVSLRFLTRFSPVPPQGFLRFITGFSPEAQLLRSQLVIKIIPMLNPDGVVSGNYRCSLAGTDLNRRYDNPSRYLFPTIHATKALLSRFAAQRKVMLYCDIHGHSRRFNTFIYGCSPPGTPPLDAARCRVYPHLLFKDSPADVPALPLRGSSTVLSTMSRPRPASASLPSRPKPGALTSNTNQRVTEAMEPVRGRFSFLDCSFVVQDSKRATG